MEIKPLQCITAWSDTGKENSENLKMFEPRPGVYSNIDPDRLQDCNVPDFDLNR